MTEKYLFEKKSEQIFKATPKFVKDKTQIPSRTSTNLSSTKYTPNAARTIEIDVFHVNLSVQ